MDKLTKTTTTTRRHHMYSRVVSTHEFDLDVKLEVPPMTVRLLFDGNRIDMGTQFVQWVHTFVDDPVWDFMDVPVERRDRKQMNWPKHDACMSDIAVGDTVACTLHVDRVVVRDYGLCSMRKYMCVTNIKVLEGGV